MQSYIKIVCPCSPNVPMDLVQIGGLVYERCVNCSCINKFPYDCVMKIEDKVHKYYEENHKFDGFVNYFRYKESQMRAKVIKVEKIAKDEYSITVEVANLTKQPEYKMKK